MRYRRRHNSPGLRTQQQVRRSGSYAAMSPPDAFSADHVESVTDAFTSERNPTAAPDARQPFACCIEGRGMSPTNARKATPMIEVENLSKRYGTKLAVDGLNFVVQPGIVTGFLGPNGSGKSTTMRMIAGLDQPTAGRVTVNGGDYRSAAAPMAELGVLLEAKAVHTGRSARNHLLALAQTNGIKARRVDEVIDIVGLQEVAGKRVGGFSLGMGQRLGVASALLGNPRTVVLDEPVNGLDPEGVRWMRAMLKDLAADGHTVFVSSHLMSEMAQTATRLVVIGRGHLIADTTVDEFVARASNHSVTVRTPEAARLRDLLLGPDIIVTNGTGQPDVLGVDGLTAEHIGTIAWQNQIPIFELTVQQASLEEAFMTLTNDSVEYRSTEIPATQITDTAAVTP